MPGMTALSTAAVPGFLTCDMKPYYAVYGVGAAISNQSLIDKSPWRCQGAPAALLHAESHSPELGQQLVLDHAIEFTQESLVVLVRAPPAGEPRSVEHVETAADPRHGRLERLAARERGREFLDRAAHVSFCIPVRQPTG